MLCGSSNPCRLPLQILSPPPPQNHQYPMRKSVLFRRQFLTLKFAKGSKNVLILRGPRYSLYIHIYIYICIYISTRTIRVVTEPKRYNQCECAAKTSNAMPPAPMLYDPNHCSSSLQFSHPPKPSRYDNDHARTEYTPPEPTSGRCCTAQENYALRNRVRLAQAGRISYLRTSAFYTKLVRDRVNSIHGENTQ